MKIAIFVDGLPPKIIGGTEIATYNIARSAKKSAVIPFLMSELVSQAAAENALPQNCAPAALKRRSLA